MKRKLKKEIWCKNYKGDHANVRFSDLPIDILRPDDIIDIHREESFHSENESWDAFTEITIFREVEETDAEYNKRVLEDFKRDERNKKMRYESYLKLKKEFE